MVDLLPYEVVSHVSFTLPELDAFVHLTLNVVCISTIYFVFLWRHLVEKVNHTNVSRNTGNIYSVLIKLIN